MPRISSTRARARYASVALVVTVAAACGGNHGSASPSSGSGTPPPTTAPAPANKFGTLDSPCGGGTAKGATADGVTDTSITIGYGDDKGYASAPGLDKEMSDAVKAIIGWCNGQGGINGRKIVGNYYDGKVLQVTQAITQACNDKVFMLVGQGYVLDDGQETLRIKCKLSSIPGFAVSTAFAHGSGVEEPIPAAGDQVSASSAFEIAKMFPDAVKKAALVFAEFPATRETRDKAAAAYPRAGWNFLNCDQIYNIQGESDWKPLATNLKSCGVEVVEWVGSPDPNMENFLNAARQVGFTPKAWVTDPNGYTAAFAKWNGQNGGAGDNVYVRMTGVPFELAGQFPAVKQYIDLVTKANGTTGLLGEQAMSAFLLWATGVKACGSNVTAKCVLDQVATQKQWTGGGLHVPGDPGTNTAPNCGMLLKLEGAKWVKVVPAGNELFDCNPEYLVTGITTNALKAAKLNSDRIATEYGTFTPSWQAHAMNLLINGLITGAVFAIAASGLVVTYSTSGVFNFAHGALGMLCAYVYWDVRVNRAWPAPLALVFVLLLIAPALGALLYRVVIRGIQDASEVVKLVVPISVLLALIATANWIWKPDQPHSLQPFFGPDHKVTVFGVVLLWHDLTIVFVAIALAIVLRLLLYRTRLGVSMRGLSSTTGISWS